jgi:flavin reductase (DIM6/NTAB) family NADH-FMN oxidoreductase RutF
MKRPVGAHSYMYPMPVTLVGALVDGRPNFLTIAYCGIAQRKPPMMFVTLGRGHHTNAGIKEHGTFSVNIPSVAQVVPTDYCGLVSGAVADKSEVFRTFFGTLGTAPLIEDCPVNLECRLVDVIDLEGSNEIFLGEIVEIWADEACLGERDLPDLALVEPMVFSQPDNSYWRIGDRVARGWSAGKEYQAG